VTYRHARSLDGLPADVLYVPLQPALVSYTQALRLSALRLLAAPAVQPGARRDAAERCLQAEEAPLDVQGVRARVLRIGRLAQGIAEAEAGADSEGAELCARWFTGVARASMAEEGRC
jgi:U3 small nucleolar RNA-associated protein 20